MIPGPPEDDFKFEDLDVSERRNDNEEVDDAVPQSPVIARDHEGQELSAMELDVLQGNLTDVRSLVLAALECDSPG